MSKLGNEYQRLIDPRLFEKMPKTVLAAVAVGFLSRLVESADELILDNPSRISFEIWDEWKALHQAGIVPQKPAKIDGVEND